MVCLSYYCLYFLFNKIGEKGRTGFVWKWGMGGEGKKHVDEEQWGEMAQTMYVPVNK
jgi:hypothetical protein